MKQLTLRVKLLIALLIVALIPISVLAVLNFINIRSTLIEAANKELFNVASETAITVDTFIKNTLDMVRAEAQLPDFAAYLALPVDQRGELESKIRNTPQCPWR